MKVSVVIVSYNARYYLEQCLQSVLTALHSVGGEIIVVDNNSPEKPIDFIRDKFPTVHFIESPTNLGFGKANNVGVEKAKGEYVLILNPDTLIPEDLFEKILPFADSKSNLGALGVRLIDADGNFHPESKRNIPTFQNTFGKLFGSLVNSKRSKSYYKTEVAEDEIAPAEILVGAFMLLRKSVYQEVGGFDEAYFMYGEDIDLSYTLVLNGFTNYYYGKSTVIHYKGESTRKDTKYLKVFFGAMKIFIGKYYRNNPIQFFLFNLGLRIRYYLARSKGAFKKEDKITKAIIPIENMQRIESEKEINKKSAQILLDGSVFSHQQMIEIISNHAELNRQFFIHPNGMNVIIGDSRLTEIKP